MPDKEGSDDEKKSTKSVVNKKQKQFLNQEEKVVPSGVGLTKYKGSNVVQKESEPAITLNPIKGLKKMNKQLDGLLKLKKEELDLTKIAEAFGGYVISEKQTNPRGRGLAPGEDPDEVKKELRKLSRAERKREELMRQKSGGRLDASKDDEALRQGKTDSTLEGGRTTFDDDEFQRPESKPIKPIKGRTPLATDPEQLGRAGPVKTFNVKDKPKLTPQQRYSRALKTTEKPVTKKGPSVKRGDPISQTVKPVKNIAARKSAEDKIQSLVKPKLTPRQRYAQTLEKAKPTVIKGGPSVKRGDPVPQIVKPVKKKPVPEIGGYKFNTFSPKEMKKRKTFKQAFGRPTGADPKTGKPTYRVSPVGPAGQKRKRTRGGFKALPRSKNLPDYDTTKTAVDMGLNPDEIDKNKFIDQEVRKTRMKRLGTDDPFEVDTSQASKEVAKQFGTKPVKGGLDFGEPTVPKKVKTQDPLTGRDFKRFRKQQQTAVRTKVRSDIEKNIGKVAKRNVSKAKIATPVVKTLGKETGEAAVKAAGKRALKKAGMKAVAKQIPGVGSLIAGGEAAFRAAKGDMTGAALSLGQAIPGVSIPLAGVDVAREVARARGGAKVGQKVATQVARSLPGSGKKVKDATKVVNPTVVGSAADTSKRFRDFLKKNKMMGIAGGAALGKGVEVASRNTFRGLKPSEIKGGRAGRRSAKQ